MAKASALLPAMRPAGHRWRRALTSPLLSAAQRPTPSHTVSRVASSCASCPAGLSRKTQADVEKALADVGLAGVASNPEESAEVQPGQVFKQSVAAGASAKEGDKIAFTVALAPAEVAVPNVVGKVRDDAKAQITGAKLGFDYTTAYSDSVAEDVGTALPARFRDAGKAAVP